MSQKFVFHAGNSDFVRRNCNAFLASLPDTICRKHFGEVDHEIAGVRMTRPFRTTTRDEADRFADAMLRQAA